MPDNVKHGFNEENIYKCVICNRRFTVDHAKELDFVCVCGDENGMIREYCMECDSFIEFDDLKEIKWVIELEATEHEVQEHFDVMHGGTSLPFTIRRKYQRRKKDH